ncbi:MAG TPA: hypothetical protein VK437_17280 [Steroidobacteraceae bacterium]|nr:hypothetical protein [Steroidobacteraceae bacterium]
MPIYECDPWRMQYFTEVYCPAEVHIPTDDVDGYKFNPRHRWIYNKLLVAQSQGLECGLHDSPPPRYPVFCKPVTNLKGMGAGSCVLEDERDYRLRCSAGDFWMKLLSGDHVSTDWAVVQGETSWCRHSLGIPGVGGTFDYWVVEAGARPRLERYCREWIREHLSDYTGMINIETIGGRIIEAHLRFADQWPDLYGRGWLDAVVRLYHRGDWEYADSGRVDGYSVALFGPHGRSYRHPPPEALSAYRASAGISSLQITFCEDRPPHTHVMPPGGFRLAVINSLSIAAAMGLRATLARGFGVEESRQREPAHGVSPVASDPSSVYW